MATALITGASAGLGAEFARQLAAQGNDLVIAARSKDRLEKLAATLRAEHGVQVEVITADLATPAGTDKVIKRLTDASRPVDLLVNNAGHGHGASFLENDIAKEIAALDLMVRAVMVLAHAAAHAMIPRGSGAILNVASVAAWMGYGTYAAHKAWVTSFTEGLAGELRGTGVTATVVLPGLTHTEFHERANLDSFDGMSEVVWLRPENVVKSALKATRKGRVLVTPSLRYAVVANFTRVLPRTWVRGFTRGQR